LIAIALLALVAYLMGQLVKLLVRGGSAVAGAEQKGEEAARRVAGKAAAIRVLEQLDVSGSRQGSPPSSS
jgi:hypothetical protein